MISKIKIIQGDCSIIGLGISDADKKSIIDNCSLIYHCAATIRFDEKLKRAVELNTRGTQEMISLALQCKKLEVRLCNVKQMLKAFECLRIVTTFLCYSPDVRLHINRILPSSWKLSFGKTLRPTSRSTQNHQVRWAFARGRSWIDGEKNSGQLAKQLRLHKM